LKNHFKRFHKFESLKRFSVFQMASISTSTSDKEIECNFNDEITKEDQLMIDKLQLTEEQLKLKEENIGEFWKSVAETLRINLSDSLEDNQEVKENYIFRLQII
jgi:uncharacterized FlaG/YvyC family protein